MKKTPLLAIPTLLICSVFLPSNSIHPADTTRSLLQYLPLSPFFPPEKTSRDYLQIHPPYSPWQPTAPVPVWSEVVLYQKRMKELDIAVGEYRPHVPNVKDDSTPPVEPDKVDISIEVPDIKDSWGIKSGEDIEKTRGKALENFSGWLQSPTTNENPNSSTNTVNNSEVLNPANIPVFKKTIQGGNTEIQLPIQGIPTGGQSQTLPGSAEYSQPQN